MWFFTDNKQKKQDQITDDRVLNSKEILKQAAKDLTNSAATLRAEISNSDDFTRKIRSIYDNFSDAIVIMDHKGVIVSANKVAEDMFGYGSGEMSNLSVDVLTTSKTANHDAYVQRYTDNTNGSYNVDVVSRIVGHARDLQAKRKNGEIFEIELSIAEVARGATNTPLFMGVIRDITARKTAEHTLTLQKKFFENILDCLPIDVFIKDSEGRYVFGNASFCSNYQVDVNQCEIKDADMGWGCLPAVRSEDATILQTSTPLHIERELRGRWKYIGKTKLVHDGAELIAGFSMDIHENKMNSKFIYDQSMRLRAIFDNANYGIVVVDGVGTIIETNHFFVRMFGSNAVNLCDMVANKDKHIISSLLRVNAGIETASAHVTMRSNDEMISCKLSANYLANSDNHMWFMVSVEDNRMNETVTRRIAGMTAAIEFSYGRAIITDAMGTILYASPELLSVYGYSADEVIGNNPRMFNSGTHPTEYFSELWDTISSGNVWHGEITNVTKTGTMVTEKVTMSKVVLEGEAYYLAVKSSPQ